MMFCVTFNYVRVPQFSRHPPDICTPTPDKTPGQMPLKQLPSLILYVMLNYVHVPQFVSSFIRVLCAISIQ